MQNSQRGCEDCSQHCSMAQCPKPFLRTRWKNYKRILNTIGRTLKIDCHVKCSAAAQLLGILIWDAHIFIWDRSPAYLVTPPRHQAVHDIKWVVARPFQHKPRNRVCISTNMLITRFLRFFSNFRPTFHPRCPGDRVVRCHCISAQALVGLQGRGLGREVLIRDERDVFKDETWYDDDVGLVADPLVSVHLTHHHHPVLSHGVPVNKQCTCSH